MDKNELNKNVEFDCPRRCGGHAHPYANGRNEWACLFCGARGDSLDLASYIVIGKPFAALDEQETEALRVRCVELGLCRDDEGLEGV